MLLGFVEPAEPPADDRPGPVDLLVRPEPLQVLVGYLDGPWTRHECAGEGKKELSPWTRGILLQDPLEERHGLLGQAHP